MTGKAIVIFNYVEFRGIDQNFLSLYCAKNILNDGINIGRKHV